MRVVLNHQDVKADEEAARVRCLTPPWLIGSVSYHPRLVLPSRVQTEAAWWISKGGSAVLWGPGGSGKSEVVVRSCFALEKETARQIIEWTPHAVGVKEGDFGASLVLKCMSAHRRCTTLIVHDDSYENRSSKGPSLSVNCAKSGLGELKPLGAHKRRKRACVEDVMLSPEFGKAIHKTQCVLLSRHAPSPSLVAALRARTFQFPDADWTTHCASGGGLSEIAAHLFPHISDHTGAFYHEYTRARVARPACPAAGTQLTRETVRYWEVTFDQLSTRIKERDKGGFCDLWPRGASPFTVAWQFAEAYMQGINQMYMSRALRTRALCAADARLAAFPPGVVGVIEEYFEVCLDSEARPNLSGYWPSRYQLLNVAGVANIAPDSEREAKVRMCVNSYVDKDHGDAYAFDQFMHTSQETKSSMAFHTLAVLILCVDAKDMETYVSSGAPEFIASFLSRLERDGSHEVLCRTACAISLLFMLRASLHPLQFRQPDLRSSSGSHAEKLR